MVLFPEKLFFRANHRDISSGENLIVSRSSRQTRESESATKRASKFDKSKRSSRQLVSQRQLMQLDCEII